MPLLDYTVTSLLAHHRDVAARYLQLGSLPLPTLPPLLGPPPALVPVLQERTARDAFMRMMARSAPPSDIIIIDD